MAEKEKKSRMKTAGGFFIPGGLFIGLGAGFAAYAAVMLIGRD